MEKELKYPVGCTISWCKETFEVIENYNDRSGTVKQGDEVITNFYFTYDGEEAVVVNR